MRSGRTGGNSGVSPWRTISFTLRRGQLPRRVTHGCFIMRLNVMRSFGFCTRQVQVVNDRPHDGHGLSNSDRDRNVLGDWSFAQGKQAASQRHF